MTKILGIPQNEKELLEMVSKHSLMEYTENICREVRLSGTEEELRSFKYAKKMLDSFGIKTKIIFFDALISLPKKAELIVNGTPYECITHSMAKGASIGIDGQLLIVEKESLEHVDMRDKIILINGIANREVIQKVAKKNALAVIFINANFTHEMTVSQVWGNPVPETVNLLPTLPIISVTKKTGELLTKNIKKVDGFGTIRTEVETEIKKIPTLIAEIIGQEEKEKFVLFSGHIDSWHYGAMDNGTANATMIEVARVLSQNKDKLRRSVKIAFWSGHSHGRYAGSTCYCDENWEELNENCFVHINIDSVGAKGADILTSGACMKETKKIARETIGALTGQIYKGSRFGRAGDQSFWGTGTPSLFMGLSLQTPKYDDLNYLAFEDLFTPERSHGFGWWWHTTEDKMDKIDSSNLERDCKIYLLTIYRFLTDLIIPIDQYEAIIDFEQAINQWKELAGNHLNFDRTIERIFLLKNQLTRFNEIVQNISVNEVEKGICVNSAIMSLSRIFVPLNYVQGSIYDHDLAIKQEAVPRLSGIHQLRQYDPKSKEYLFIKTSLIRKLNEINYLLKQANEIIQKNLLILVQ